MGLWDGACHAVCFRMQCSLLSHAMQSAFFLPPLPLYTGAEMLAAQMMSTNSGCTVHNKREGGMHRNR